MAINKITPFKCSHSNSVGICKEVTEMSGLKFPDAYKHSDTMKVLAKTIKKHDGAGFVLLPFCRTVEIEAMGAPIKYGDTETGPRASDPICSNISEIMELNEIDFTSGRISEVLKACKELKTEGETVAIEITGPFTILCSLMDARKLFKALRKEREETLKAFKWVGMELLKYIDLAKDAGVDLIIYSDSAGAPEILGPKVTTEIINDFYHQFFADVKEHLGEKGIMLICPKLTNALIDTGYAEYKFHEFGRAVDFLEAMLEMRDRGVNLAGQVCIKNIRVRLANGRFKEIIIK